MLSLAGWRILLQMECIVEQIEVEQIELRIVDDPSNVSVYKGPGHYAATRAQIAIRKVEEAFPHLRFEVVSDHQLASLKATAVVGVPIGSGDFIAVLTEALAATGTRVAPAARC